MNTDQLNTLLKAHLQATLNYSECKVTHFVYCGRFRDYYKPHYGINNFNNLSKNRDICRYCTIFEYLHHVISVISIFMESISDSPFSGHFKIIIIKKAKVGRLQYLKLCTHISYTLVLDFH